MLPTISEVLREAIGEKGHAIATQTGVSFPVIYRFMKGERTLTLPTAEKLCAHLNLVLTEAKPTKRADHEHRTAKPRKQRRKRAEKQ
jgi:transcriptional regulator with XRE-family HTH domain